MKDGILNIYKEKGYTSFDVIAVLRGKLKMKRLGHTGTLDPEAEGVLPVCIGKATKIADDIAGSTKTYLATFQLGSETDTQDHTGKVLSVSEVTCTRLEIEKAIQSLVGNIQQIPPMYSALKVNGQKLYDLARQGKVIERMPRAITIESITDIQINIPNISMRIVCSKGTYIRTLCYDIGQILGCGAHMTSLIREKTGRFQISESFRLGEIDALIEAGTLENHILPIEEVFIDLPKLMIKTEYNRFLTNGNKLKHEMLQIELVIEEDKQYRVYDSKEHFFGVYTCILQQEELILKPRTVFTEGVGMNGKICNT